MRLNRRQQFKEMALLAQQAITKTETLCNNPNAILSLQDEIAGLKHYSHCLGGIALIQRALDSIEPNTPLTNARDIWLRLADSLSVEAGMDLSEKEFIIRTNHRKRGICVQNVAMDIFMR